MPSFGILGSTTPMYGGGMVKNPANVLVLTAAPSASAIGNPVGTVAVDRVTGIAYMAVKNTGISGTVTWAVLGGATSAVGTINSNAPIAGNYVLAGTANQITATDTAGTTTFSIPAAFTAPGSVTATTSLTATLGAITATNGNLVFGTAGNKILSTSVASTITAGANSFGTVTLVGGTATVSTTAVTANSIIMLTRMSIGATGAAPIGMLSVGTVVAATSFDINAATTATASTPVATDVSVVGWMIIN